MSLNGLSARARVAVLACTLCASGCEREIERPGQLIVAVDTDMALPQQVDTLHIKVEVQGRIEYQNQFEVGPRSAALLPATLTIYADEPSDEPVTVKIAGSKATREGLDWRTYREATMPVPHERVATLRMPIQWLCKGTAEAATGGDDTPLDEPSAQSTCGAGYTCRAGRCEEGVVETSELPNYRPQDVFGGGATPEQGSCFDTVGCMAVSRTVVPDEACQIDKPDGTHFNVALRVLNDGICDVNGVNCFVPLDGLSPEGWMVDGDRVQLPPAVCDKLAEGLVRAVLVSEDCEMKSAGVPACGPWSSVPKGRAGQYRPSGPVMPGTTVLTTLPTEDGATRCCPLMAANDKLFTCVCAGTSSATVFEIDPAESTTRRVGTLNPPSTRTEPLAASVFDGSLYWAAGNEVRRTPLEGNEALASGFTVPAPSALYETGSLLADATHIYALASGGAGADETSVQLFSIARDRSSAPAPLPVGDVPVFQFDHDEDAVYLAVDRDEPIDSGIRRNSSIVRIEKDNGQRSTLMSERTLELPSPGRGGYIGVRVRDGVVYALYETIDADGAFRVQLHTLQSNASNGQPETRYDAPIDPARTRVRLLGVAGRGVLLTQFGLEGDQVESAAILALAATPGEPRTVAEFANDFPVDGIGLDESRVYWLNASGTVYALPRVVLE